MGFLYKEPEDIVFEAYVEPRKDHENIKITFSNDGGKFGTHEILDEYDLTPLQLLEILQEHSLKEL